MLHIFPCCTMNYNITKIKSCFRNFEKYFWCIILLNSDGARKPSSIKIQIILVRREHRAEEWKKNCRVQLDLQNPFRSSTTCRYQGWIRTNSRSSWSHKKLWLTQLLVSFSRLQLKFRINQNHIQVLQQWWVIVKLLIQRNNLCDLIYHDLKIIFQ